VNYPLSNCYLFFTFYNSLKPSIYSFFSSSKRIIFYITKFFYAVSGYSDPEVCITYPFNVDRDRESVFWGLVDLLLLARTRIVVTSHSSFLALAQRLGRLQYAV
jgi:hypothetical protein